MTVHVIAYDTRHPGDVDALGATLERFAPDRIRRIAILAKTEGNSDVNDFSREYGLLSARLALVAHGGEALADAATMLFSTGCEGAMTPFGYLIVDTEDDTPVTQTEALAFGLANSRPIAPEEVGTPAHADLVTDAVKAAMADAGVTADEVGLVIVKTPVMSHAKTTAPGKGKRITSGFSKAVAALGAGVALGEVDRARVTSDAFDSDHTLHANRAIVFSGSETDRAEVILFANRKGAPGTLRVHAGVLADLLDAPGVRKTLSDAGLTLEDGTVTDPDKVAAMILKVGLNPDGRLRGHRTTMRSSHLDMDKHLRATMSGIIGSILGTPRTFISANTVHQAPPGGGICACIVSTGE
ncbi:ring-opening amidohydrolase [Acuticoccus sp. M5D2P5]|uniref:ring-opening amidohydrolase n=1 Tax=Acuticoccus kalidii TaxID=2910977 RepID=UPI001F27907F|nr:ring-opening amidohydrolase [Acuticoccus kalidii]MCF3934778.1 ring-opening amidohydrolase [Acuticoccus kalidii]